MSNFEKDVPIEELRHKYLRKYPLETASDSFTPTPGYKSYYSIRKRTSARLACDIVLFVTFMIFIFIVTCSFATSYNLLGGATLNGSSYGVLPFFFQTASSLESAANSINYAQSFAPEIFIPKFISELVLCITALEIAITTLVCFIIAIVHFSKKSSLKLVNIVTYYFCSIIGAYIVFIFFGEASAFDHSGYKISGAVTFGMVMMTLVLIGCSITMFISKRRIEAISKKLWIANIIFASIGALCVAILGTSRLGNAVYVAFNLLYNGSVINLNEYQITTLAMIIIFIAFVVCFRSLNGALKNSFRHMLSLDETEALPKVKEYSPLKDSIVMAVSILIAVAATAFIYDSSIFKVWSYDILVQGVFVLLFSIALIVTSAIFRNRQPKSAVYEISENEITVKPAPAQPKPIAKPIVKEAAHATQSAKKPIPKPAPKPVPRSAPQKSTPAAQPVAKQAPKPMPKPVPKPIAKPVSKESAKAPVPKPTQKIVIKIPKNK